MKKTLLSLGFFAGATLSAFALASCSGPTTVKDLEGNDYTIQTSEDAEVVSKALVLSAKAMAEREAKVYAVGADAKFSAEVETTYMDVKLKANVNANGAVKFSIGQNEYTSYFDLDKGPESAFTEAQIAAAKKELGKNLKLEMSGSVDASITASTEKEEAKEMAETLNGQKAKLSAAAYFVNATDDTDLMGYTELEGNMSAALYGLAAAMLPEGFEFKASEDGKEYKAATYTKTAVNMDSTTPTLSTYLAYYQKNGFDAKVLAMANLPIKLEEDKPLIDKDFFESDAYKALQTYVSTLGVKITEAAGGKVTFALDLTGEKIQTVGTLAAATAGNAQAVVQATAALSKLEKTKKYVSASLTLDVAAGIVSQVKVAVEDLSFLPNVYAGLPVKELKGKVSLEVNAYTDGNVKFTKTPDANKTYTDTTKVK